MARSPELEGRVLEALWQGGEWSVRDVHNVVDPALAYTTFATVLDRLHAKGEVDRAKDGRHWVYSAARSKDQVLAAEVAQVLQRADVASEGLLVAFIDSVEQVDPDALDRLEALLRARRADG